MKISGMTSNEEDIARITGLKIGKVYFKDKEYDAQKSGNRILDCNSGNFHLFPVLNEDQKKEWKNYLRFEKRILEKLKERIDNSIVGRGNLIGIPRGYEGINKFYQYLQVENDGRKYLILLKRFYVDKNDCVNCIFGKVQFYSSNDGYINEEDETVVDNIVLYTSKDEKKTYEIVPQLLIHYPKSYQGQNEKMIRLSATNNRVNMYNPKKIKDINDILDSKDANDIPDSEIDQFVEGIMKSFESYISKIQHVMD